MPKKSLITAKKTRAARSIVPNAEALLLDGLGPRQRALLHAARLKKYNRGKPRIGHMYDGEHFDFLGIACILAGVEPKKVRGYNVYTFGPKKLVGKMPHKVVRFFGFRDGEGTQFLDSTVTLGLLANAGNKPSKIANRIAAHPDYYFNDPK